MTINYWKRKEEVRKHSLHKGHSGQYQWTNCCFKKTRRDFVIEVHENDNRSYADEIIFIPIIVVWMKALPQDHHLEFSLSMRYLKFFNMMRCYGRWVQWNRSLVCSATDEDCSVRATANPSHNDSCRLWSELKDWRIECNMPQSSSKKLVKYLILINSICLLTLEAF